MSAFPARAPVVKFLNVTNPLYSAGDRLVAEAMYAGGNQFEAIKNSILDPRAADCNPLYRRSRLAIARYTDWCAGIFDNYVQTAFSNPPKIVFSIDEELGIADEDAEAKLDYYNSLNDGLEDLLQGRNRDMILHGSGYLTVSFPDVGLDAQLCYLSPLEVEDWELDLMGNLIWIKTHQVQFIRTIPYGPADSELHTWTYYTPDSKVIYNATKKKDKEWDEKRDFGAKTDEISYSLGLPIFECHLSDRINLFERIKIPAQGLFNTEADWAFARKSQCYGQPWVASDKNMNEIIGGGSGNANEFSIWQVEKGGEIGYAVPQNVAFDTIKAAAEIEKQSLFTTMNSEALQIGEKDQHAASGEAKAQDKQPAEAVASAYARSLRCTLCDAIDYILAARKDTDIISYKLIGLDNFNPITIASKIANVTAYMALPGSETAKRIAINDLDQTMAINATPEEREQIDDEKDGLDVAPKPVVVPNSNDLEEQDETDVGPTS